MGSFVAEYTFSKPLTLGRLEKTWRAFRRLIEQAHKDCGLPAPKLKISNASMKGCCPK